MDANQITIPVKGASLRGELSYSPDCLGLIVFAHGSGSSSQSPRNQAVAGALQRRKLGTLLFDLLTDTEEQAEFFTRHLRFNIRFLADRLVSATGWALDHITTRDLNIGYFGASTGAAAALAASVSLSDSVSAIVSRGGRPDLAGDTLHRVTASTLLIVGKNDHPVIPLNEQAYEQLTCEKSLRLVPGASHLFEEAGALEMVAQMASEWFVDHLQPITRR
jgi:putative phosphoribosyl transferase